MTQLQKLKAHLSAKGVILKLLRIHKFVSIDRIRAYVLFKSGNDIPPRKIRKIIQDMRKKDDIYIGTSYKKGEGFYLVKTLKQHENNLKFWQKKINSASKMKALAVKCWDRKTAKLLK